MRDVFIYLLSFIAPLTSICQELHPLGAKLDPVNDYKLIETRLFTTSDIDKLDKKNSYFLLNTPPPKDQGDIGSCVGWALGYTFLSVVLFGSGNSGWNDDNEISPSFLYNYELYQEAVVKKESTTPPTSILGNAFSRIATATSIDCNTGINIAQAIKIIQTEGACVLSNMKYTTDCRILPSQAQRDMARSYALNPRTGAYDILNKIYSTSPSDVESLKYLLQFSKAPIVVGLEVTTAFDDMWKGNGEWRANYGPSRGGHAACIIGFNDSTEMFKCQNSWGQGGNNGYFSVSYEMVKSGCLKEAFFIFR